ncbi:uncharacterized protein LOC120630151 [Pararge aegeria]|uniref:Jg5810 protein n=1 Tax=Pararge aegeria aegeria TaxID=348720 RepID=A0A8S4R1S0_9NEOP|nr:uncharacterized protein LOC120630151 [Pararge aegeria]CAH2229804.1 jg5810 [Pararge aegeria aegeria]
MARGDECKTATKATYACKQFDVSAPAPIKKQVISQIKPVQPPKKPEQKNYGAWGSTFKDKKTFLDMHFC